MTPGVLYLLASVTCSVTVAVLLKLARRYDVDVRQAIAMNYAVAALLCWAVLKPNPAALFTPSTPWAVLAALGVLLPSVFLAMAAAVRHAGIVRSDAAQRLSLFIPLLAAFLLFGEPVNGRKLAAVLLAFAALACLLLRPTRWASAGAAARTPGTAGTAATAATTAATATATTTATAAPATTTAATTNAAASDRGIWLWPLAVWAGYGVIDILFKQVARAGTAFAGGLLLAFVLAGVLMLAYLLARRVRWQPRHLLAGAALGVANFGNILTYIRAHQSLPEHPALVFASMNMGVITLGTLVGALVFREPLTRINALGIALALGAIVVMAPW
ncbi:EamA family transporter [Achromobacter sp. LC458]|uniref:EamA family transporter n=1 Tax=Achromobacter sp. LC458 TaxID=1120623 RepID=UPI00163D9D9D|nr:EamA family transporter [Achromobacter sp. LC458]